ncbi:MAG: PfkB family carbohydrate kinase [Vampirovibrionales bacterium]|nr:PfkB family carbohydrate kinase [Vampirovibrionales bacterium]
MTPVPLPHAEALRQRLSEAIGRLNTGKVLVVGDFALDEMVYGTTERLSREAPVLILHHHHTDLLLGAGSNAAHNVAALGAHTTHVAGVCGNDAYQHHLLEALHQAGVQSSGLVMDASRPTTTKTRISGMANHSVTQQMVRIDRESRQPLSSSVEAELLDNLSTLAPHINALLLSDYGLGVMTPAVIAHCQQLAKDYHLLLSADSHQPLKLFAGATVVTPNQPEAEANVGHDLNTWFDRFRGGKSLLTQTGVQHVLMTLGGDGMLLCHRDGETLLGTVIPVFNRSDVFDVTGAGDTVIATLTLALATGASLVEAAVLGNLAASIVVKKYGTAVTSVHELQEALNQLSAELLNRITTRTLEEWQSNVSEAPVLVAN